MSSNTRSLLAVRIARRSTIPDPLEMPSPHPPIDSPLRAPRSPHSPPPSMPYSSSPSPSPPNSPSSPSLSPTSPLCPSTTDIFERNLSDQLAQPSPTCHDHYQSFYYKITIIIFLVLFFGYAVRSSFSLLLLM